MNVEPDAPPHPVEVITQAAQPLPAVSPVPAPGSQSTAIEQSRAVAEVQAMVIVAQQAPRNESAAITRMRQSCGRLRVAERAFYRFNRGEGNVTGSSIHLMVELGRCWGNITQGLTELRRDVDAGVSEMQAWAWDLESNYRVVQSFIVPHIRDRSGGAKTLTSQRDIYEHLTNQGNRRVREMLRKVLPPWFVEEAEDVCHKTLDHGEGTPIPRRIADAINLFDTLGVRVDQLEQKLERPQDRWTGYDVGVLSIIYRSIRAGEISVDDEFPQPRVTVEEITGAQVSNGTAPTGNRGGGQATEPDPAPAGAAPTNELREWAPGEEPFE